MRRRSHPAWPAAVVAGLAAGAAWWLVSPPAQGDAVTGSIVQVGWWSQQPGAQAQASGGFQVTLGPQGPLSIAAVEINVGSAQSATTTLTLAEASTSVGSSRAVLQACSIPGSWSTANDNPGAWSAAPPYDCSAPVALNRDATSATWTADVSALAPPGQTSSLMIVPVPQPVGGVLDPGFQVTFTGASVKVVGTSASSDATAGGLAGGGPADTAPPSSPAPSDALAAPAGPASPPAFVTPAAEAPTPADTPSVTPPASQPGPPGSAPPVTSPAVIATPSFARSAAHGSHGEDRPWWRLALFVPLAAAAGAGAVELRRRAALAT